MALHPSFVTTPVGMAIGLALTRVIKSQPKWYHYLTGGGLGAGAGLGAGLAMDKFQKSKGEKGEAGMVEALPQKQQLDPAQRWTSFIHQGGVSNLSPAVQKWLIEYRREGGEDPVGFAKMLLGKDWKEQLKPKERSPVLESVKDVADFWFPWLNLPFKQKPINYGGAVRSVEQARQAVNFRKKKETK